MNKFMIHLQSAVYANELYSYPSLAGKHIFELDKAIERAEQLFPDCNWIIYNGQDSFSNTEDIK